jgi:chondroitin AC lyase
MMNKLNLYAFLFLILTGISGCQQPEIVYPEPLVQLHKNIIADILAEPADFDSVEKYLAALKVDGSWPDIDYTSKERGGWPPRNHISKLLVIAKAYQTNGTPLYHKKAVSEKIHLALNFWLENDFQCPNWWYPEIGVPQVLAPVMILMEAELSAEQFEKGIRILNRSAIGMTGQNKVWQSGNVLLRNLLLKNEDTIRMAATSIQEELVVSTGEGVQPDWSYHQHGPQLQFGNYGLAYVGDMIQWITIFRNTPFQFDESKISVLRNYLLEGQQWVTWENLYDISACGRQLFPNAQKSKAASLARFFSKMETLDPEFVAEYQKANQYQNLSGNRHFWRTDFHVYRSPEYYFSVKMCSKRVIGAESCNSENIQGYYMGDGATFLYQTEQEFNDIFPFWDWKKIPGTTVHQDNDTLPVLTARGYRIESNFVGGVSDGKNGIAVMDYKRNGLNARKSWFMFDDNIVCLGSAISSAENLPISTSINQSFLKGDVIIKTLDGEKSAGEAENLKNPDWIIHDNIGYIFPLGGNLKLETREVNGSWNWVATRYPEEIVRADIFKLWFEHGINPKSESYQYILVPNASKQKMKEMELNKPFKIRNEKDIQEVISAYGKIAGVVFYQPGKSGVFGGIEVDKPCLVMVKNQTDGLWVSVADPTQGNGEINLTLNESFSGENALVQSGKTKIKVILPKGDEAGKSVNIQLKRI